MGVYIERADNQDLNKMVKKSGNVDFTKGTTITIPSYNINRFTIMVICLGSIKTNKKNPTNQNKIKPTIKPTQTYTRVCGNN